MNIKLKVTKKNMSGEQSSHTPLSREKKEGLIVFFPAAIFSSESKMFTSLPPRRLRWSARVTGRSSPNRFPAPHSINVSYRTLQNFGVGVALPGQRLICGPPFSLDSLRLERPDANGPGLLRAGPSGEERCTQHHMVPLSPQCPRSANPDSVPGCSGLQRALLSDSSSQQCK